MPIVIAVLYLASFALTGTVTVSGNNKANEINKICVEKFKTNADIKVCKEVLRNR